MPELLITIIIGLIGGLAVGLQGPLSGIMSRTLGPNSATFIIHFSGALASGLLLLLARGENIRQWREVPWYALVSGVLGVILYLTFSHTLPRIGATGAIALLIMAQLSLTVVIDHFGWFGVLQRSIDLTKLVGAGLLLAGAYLLVRQPGA